MLLIDWSGAHPENRLFFAELGMQKGQPTINKLIALYSVGVSMSIIR